MDNPFHFKDVTLLITHYNRSSSLDRLLSTLENLKCRFDEIVVADDASLPEHLHHLKKIQHKYHFRLLTSPVNKGLGNNLNKGQDAVKTAYTLYIQEDFVPSAIFPEHLVDAVQIMNEEKDIDMIRFWAFLDAYPGLKPFGKGYAEMVYRFWNMNHLKFFMYSDTPHLRRSSFFEKFGRYKEGIKGDLTDYAMAISFIQNKGKGLFYEDYSALLAHANSPDEPSTMRPITNWRQSGKVFIRALRWSYLKYKWIKCTLDVIFMK